MREGPGRMSITPPGSTSRSKDSRPDGPRISSVSHPYQGLAKTIRSLRLERRDGDPRREVRHQRLVGECLERGVERGQTQHRRARSRRRRAARARCPLATAAAHSHGRGDEPARAPCRPRSKVATTVSTVGTEPPSTRTSWPHTEKPPRWSGSTSLSIPSGPSTQGRATRSTLTAIEPESDRMQPMHPHRHELAGRDLGDGGRLDVRALGLELEPARHLESRS